MRWLSLVASVVLVACDSKARNTASRVAGEQIGGVSNEVVRIAEESSKAALEESRKRRATELGHQETTEGLIQNMVRESQENLRSERMRQDKGFQGKFEELSVEEITRRKLSELEQKEKVRAERVRNQRGPWK